jgi:transposase
MPMRRKSTQKIREIIRLKETNFGERAISRTLKIFRPTVKQYINQISDAGLDLASINEMSDDALQEIIDGKSKIRSPRLEYLGSQFEYFVKELKRPGVTLQRLWEEYIADHPDGYGYSQFFYHFQQWRDTRKLIMHMDHKTGDKLFVDFTGKHLSIVDRVTGEEIDVEVFAAVFGASQFT